MLDPALTLEIRNRPATNVALTMRWRDLLFLHFAYDPGAIQELLPPGLSVDTFPNETGQEMAWVGLVPFRMECVRPLKLHLGRRCEDFPETNVRTYCHVEGRDPGVWFFSLDAANPFACVAARQVFKLNYREASMKVDRHGDQVHFESSRWKNPKADNSVHCRIGAEVGKAQPGSLEFFLVERYLLYAYGSGRLLRGQVFHPPYALRKVEDFTASTQLLEVNGLLSEPFTHAAFSDGVDVSAGRPERL